MIHFVCIRGINGNAYKYRRRARQQSVNAKMISYSLSKKVSA